MNKIILFALIWLFSFPAYAADNTVTLTAGSGVTMRTRDVGSGVQSPYNILGDLTGTAIYGTAGTANANVLTIQGIASGTTVPVTLTGTNNIATVTTVTAVTTITNSVAVTQSGTWNITNISGTISLPTGASTATNQTSIIGTKNAGTAATNSLLAGAVYNSTPLTVTDTQQTSLQADANGYLKVNVAAGGASGGTSSTFAATFPATGTAIGMSQGGNMVALTGTSNNLNVQCANCSGSGVSTVDAATFTASTSLFAGTGGFFQTTATSNALTNGQQGMFQVTANRAIFSNLRNASGAEVGVTGAELFVGGRGTAGTAAGGVLTVQGVASMTPVLATLSGTNNIATVTTVTTVSTLTGGGVASGATDSGNPVKVGGIYNSTPITLTNGQRGDLQLDASGFVKVAVASAVGLAQGSTTSGQTGSLVMGAVTTASPTYTTAQTSPLSLDTAGSLRVAIVSGGGSGGTSSNFGSAYPAAGTAVGFTDGTNMVAGRVGDVNNVAAATNYIDTLVIGRYNATQPTLTDTRFNALQVSSRGELLVGVGTTGFAITGTVTANAGTGTLATSNAALALAIGSTTSGSTGPIVQCAVTTAAPTYITAQNDPLSCDTAGNLRVSTGTVTVTATNLSTNVAQINGVTPLMGNGVTGTGSQRVTIASDNTAFSVNATLSAETTKVIGVVRNLGNGGAIFDGATGAAPPANVVYAGAVTSGATGGLLSGIVACDSHALLNMTTATTTEIVALTASQSIYVCSILVSSAGTSTVTVQRGTGTNCGTGTAAMSAGHELTAQVGYARGSGLGTIMRGTASNALCITSSAAVNVHIDVSYAKF